MNENFLLFEGKKILSLVILLSIKTDFCPRAVSTYQKP